MTTRLRSRHALRALAAHWPFLGALAALALVVSALLIVSLSRTAGRLVYSLDDPYIHMAMAGNLATHGVWGVTRYGFTSTSSSLLWTLSLAALYRVFGVSEAVPFLLNAVLAVLLVLAIDRLLYSHAPSMPRPLAAIILLAVVFSAPLPALIFTGHEHVLFCIVAVGFTFSAGRAIAGEGRPSKVALRLPVLAALLTTIRYEGMFLALCASLLLAGRRRRSLGLAVAAAAALPLVVYGAIAVAHGWFWLPSSVLLKAIPLGVAPSDTVGMLGQLGYKRLLKSPHIAFLGVAASALAITRLRKNGQTWDTTWNVILIFVSAALLHLFLARAEGYQFGRYEAYLVVIGTLAVGAAAFGSQGQPPQPTTPSIWPRRLASTALFVLLPLPFLVARAVTTATRTPQATRNIFEQQIQMGLFLRQYYEGSTVAANDIGAINFLADVRCLDLFGLGSAEVARMRLERQYDTQKLNALAQSVGTRVAIVYDSWFAPGGEAGLQASDGGTGIPGQWTKVWQWRISDNVICGGDTVSFYAVDRSEGERLRASLREFARRLPQAVVQKETAAR